MSMTSRWLVASFWLLTGGSPPPKEITHLIATSDLIAITTAAARAEGYKPGVEGTYLHELRTENGQEPLPGYESIGLYRAGHLERTYAVRIDTGDIVDPMRCRILRYPELLKIKRRITKTFGSREASL